jgi:hypothetical protein
MDDAQLNLNCYGFICKQMGSKPLLDCLFECLDEYNGLYTY